MRSKVGHYIVGVVLLFLVWAGCAFVAPRRDRTRQSEHSHANSHRFFDQPTEPPIAPRRVRRLSGPVPEVTASGGIETEDLHGRIPAQVVSQALLAKDNHLLWVANMRDFYAVGVGTNSDDSGKDTLREILLFHRNWRPSGRIVHLPSPSARDGSSDPAWYPMLNETRKYLFLLNQDGASLSISLLAEGKAGPELVRVYRSPTTSFNWCQPNVPTRDGVLIALVIGKENMILDVNGSSLRVREVYREPGMYAPGWHYPMCGGVLSPDGRQLAFSREGFGEMGELGIWILDLRSGRCRRYTDGVDTPLNWRDKGTLLFRRESQESSASRDLWYSLQPL